MPRVEFLLTLERYKVFPLEAELRDAGMWMSEDVRQRILALAGEQESRAAGS